MPFPSPARQSIPTVAPNVGLDKEHPQRNVKHGSEVNNNIGCHSFRSSVADTGLDKERPQRNVNNSSEVNGNFSHFRGHSVDPGHRPPGSETVSDRPDDSYGYSACKQQSAQLDDSLPDTTVEDMEIDPELCQPLEASQSVDEYVSQVPCAVKCRTVSQ